MRINPDEMPVEYLRIELEDLIARGVEGAARLLETFDKTQFEARNFIHRQRDGLAYVEYCCPWLGKPGNLKIPRYRPGYPLPEWAR